MVDMKRESGKWKVLLRRNGVFAPPSTSASTQQKSSSSGGSATIGGVIDVMATKVLVLLFTARRRLFKSSCGGIANYVHRLIGEGVDAGKIWVLTHAAPTLASSPDFSLFPIRMEFEVKYWKTS